MITASFVRAIYFVGFLLITLGGIGLAGWAGWRLRDATISRELGWRYVAYGIGAVILGNLVWRIVCEFWTVIFNLHDELVTVRQTLVADHPYTEHPFVGEATSFEPAIVPQTSEAVISDRPRPLARPTGVLGLS